jgi:hypothetical protein
VDRINTCVVLTEHRTKMDAGARVFVTMRSWGKAHKMNESCDGIFHFHDYSTTNLDVSYDLIRFDGCYVSFLQRLWVK